MFEPITVLLQFSFLILLYLFVLWVVRSSQKDLSGARIKDSEDDLRSKVHRTVSPSKEDVKQERGKLVVLRGKGLKRNASFDVGSGLTLGRASACDIRIEDQYASHQHARVVNSGRDLYLEDLRSTNGTYLNDRRVQKSVKLSPKDRVRIGDTELRYER